MTGPDKDTNLLEHLRTHRAPAVCPACDGEGYRYVENAGRHATHPITEHPCRTCGGSGANT